MRYLSLLLLAACVHFPSYPGLVTVKKGHARLLIHDVRLFRGTGPTAEEHMDVLVFEGQIQSVTPTRDLPFDTAVEIVEGAGLTLLPGLIDLHAHLTYTAAPPWYLTIPNVRHNAQAHVYAGVTTVLDLGGDVDEIRRLVNDVARGAAVGPRIFFAGQHLTAPGGYPANMIRQVYGRLAAYTLVGSHVHQPANVAAIEREVNRLHRRGATFVKLMVATLPEEGAPRLDEATIAAAVKRAHSYKMKVAAHIDSLEDAKLCARLGVDLLAHGVETSVVSEEDAAALAATGIAMEPTLVNWERWDELAAGHYVGSALERESEPRPLLASFSDKALAANMHVWSESRFSVWGAALAEHRAERPRNLAKLYAAGMPIFVGSDSEGSIATFAGAYHDELRLQVEAGLPAGEVLWSATGRAAHFLDQDARFGTIEEGKDADLLLVRGNPVQDIAATSAIVRVFVRGRPIERRAIGR